MRRVEHARPAELSALHLQRIQAAIAQEGGWLPFDRYMAMALYEPGLGYYSRGAPVFGASAADGSDFITAPELSPLFGAAVARQVQQWLVAAGCDQVFEFGAGSGALAEQVLTALDAEVGVNACRYTIVEVSGSLRARQQQRLARFGARVQWLETWPEQMRGVVLGNEVLDAMPVQLLHWDGSAWWERGVACAASGPLVWADRATALRPPVEHATEGRASLFASGAVVELHRQGEAFVRSLAERLVQGAALFIDYGFPESEYYHPQRHGGTLVCHRSHRTELDADAPLREPGSKDITAHVNFTGLALAAQEAGLQVAGYTSQARFLMNCGLLELLHRAPATPGAVQHARALAGAQKLLAEHEMGELFKAIAFTRGLDVAPLGFAAGDRTHTL
jgi:SAM-dependent MidA family methyltransferase